MKDGLVYWQSDTNIFYITINNLTLITIMHEKIYLKAVTKLF